MEGWKTALGLDRQAGWRDVGRAIAQPTSRRVAETTRTPEYLTDRLVKMGYVRVNPDHVIEYLSGDASFGIFFPTVIESLGMSSRNLFPNVESREQASEHMAGLIAYLTDQNNPESRESFFIHSPGAELRAHISRVLTRRRQEILDTPYSTFYLTMKDARKVGLNEDNPGPLPLIPSDSRSEQRQSGVELVRTDQRHSELYQALVKRCNAHVIAKNPRVVLSLADNGEETRVRAQFFYPDKEFVNRVITGEDRNEEYPAPKHTFTLPVFEEACTHGTFSSISPRDIGRSLRSLLIGMDLGIEELIPIRKPTEAELIEYHARVFTSPNKIRRSEKNQHLPFNDSDRRIVNANVHIDILNALGEGIRYLTQEQVISN